MKKIISILLIISLIFGLGAVSASAEERPLRIVTTIFPTYDWVRNVLGEELENTELIMLLDSGVDLHSYQPTVDDMIRISSCDLFVYVGGESDAWVQDALKEAANKDMVVVDLMDVLGDVVKEEEVVEGMEAEYGEEEDETEYDEHVWLSLRNAETLCAYLAECLEELDPANRESYAANAESYLARLDALDKAYQAAVDGASKKTLLFADRFPFRYLVEDYGLDYYAAFLGCSAETEASFETILFLTDKVNELGLGAILQIETADGSIARTVRDNTKAGNQTILTVNSLQSVTARDVAAGASYLSIMESNLAILREALN